MQLGFLATTFFIVYLLHENYTNQVFSLNYVDVILIIISICLFFLTIILNKEYYRSYDRELEAIIQKYKNNLEKEMTIK